MFEHFRVFFICVFQINAFLYTVPLAVKLRYVHVHMYTHIDKKVKVGKDQEKAQSEKDAHSKNRGGEKNKLTIRYLYHKNIS